MNTTNSTNNTILPRSAHVGPQTFIFFGGLVLTLFLLWWSLTIARKVRETFRQLKLLEKNQCNETTLTKIRKMKSKQNKHIYFICCILLFTAHTFGRSIIYIAFVLAEYYLPETECNQNEISEELQFVNSMPTAVFPALSITGVLFIASLICLGTFLFYVKESYSFFGKNLKPVRVWFAIGAFQIISALSLMSIPHVAILGSAAFAAYLFIDYIFLIVALNKLVRILVQKKMDATYQSKLKFRYNQCIKGIRTLSRPMLVTLFFYICGLIMEQVSTWVTVGKCFVGIYYFVELQLDAETILLTQNVASFLWIITYIATLQFYVSLLLIVLAYFCHSYKNKKESKSEQKRLITGSRPSRYYNAGYESEV